MGVFNWRTAALASVGFFAQDAAALDAEVYGGITATAQASGNGRAESEMPASFDLNVSSALPDGLLSIYIEGSTSRSSDGVSSVYPEANADAGTALAADQEGNVQVSEIKYRYNAGPGRFFTVGVLDPTAYMDRSVTSNDENTQFLGTNFVNNSAIEFPDYSLGVAFEQRFGSPASELFAVVTSSHGLGDNPSASYAQLLNVDEADKGLFLGLGGRWLKGSWSTEAGMWAHTAPHEALDGTSTGKRNYGAYAVVGRNTDPFGFDVRLGVANPEVFAAERFGAVTFEWRRGDFHYGAGYAHTFLSRELAGESGRGDTRHTELYARYAVSPSLGVTADLQRIVNSGFDSTDQVRDSDALIGGLRLDWTF